MEKFVLEIITENEEMFTKEEMDVILKNRKLIVKIYLIGLANLLNIYQRE